MINFAIPLAAGCAVRVILNPPAGAVRWRLLRRTDDAFAGQSDPGALVLIDSQDPGGDSIAALDTALINGTTYHYAEFYTLDGATWAMSPIVTAIPAASGAAIGPDVLSLVRVRLASWLAACVTAGTLPGNSAGKIPVFSAPQMFDDKALPFVDVHLQSDEFSGRALGEEMFLDSYDVDSDQWADTEGGFSSVTIEITAWALNPDARIAIRRQLQAALLANEPVFDAAGIVTPAFRFSDSENLNVHNVPLYCTIGNFTCQAPFGVRSQVGTVHDVTATGEAYLNLITESVNV